MKKMFSDDYEEAKTLPKGLWIAAVIVPGGLVTITAYLAVKAAYNKFKKEKKYDRSENS
jgi:hypothetical protein